MKYILSIDYKADTHKGIKHFPMESKNILDVMSEADMFWNEDVYMMQICQKVGNIVTPYHAGYKYETYEAVLARRSNGWHNNDSAHSEAPMKVEKHWLTNNRNEVWYEIG